MKKVTAILLIVAMAGCCFLLGSCSRVPEVQAREVTEFSKASFLGYKPGSNSWDATDFLVGEFHVNSGELARFDGRGTVTIIRPDGVNNVGLYAMTESDGKEAVVTMLLDGTEKCYSFDLISSQGDFTLTGDGGEMIFYSPVQY